jgi:parallel beta-helix repeat protein
MEIKGKQIKNDSIVKDKLALTAPVVGKDPVTKSYFDNRKVNGKALITDITLDKTDIGLPLADNTSDTSKPVSTAQRAAINEKLSYGTIAQFTSVFDSTLDAYHVTDTGKEGLFKYDASDTTSAQDGVLVLVKAGKRYKRQHNGQFFPEWWGAVGNGIANDAAAINLASNAAVLNKAEIVLNKSYKADTTSIVLKYNTIGNGTIFTRGAAAVVVGNSNMYVKNITIDGIDNTGKGLYPDGPSNVLIDGVTIKNVYSQGIWARDADNLIIANCRIDNTIGDNGDSIYVAESKNPIIINNRLSRFQRIAIATEGNPGDYTMNPIIKNNMITEYIPGVTVGFPNGGIWCEETAGAIIEGNYIEDVSPRGIVTNSNISPNAQHYYSIQNNTIVDIDDALTLGGTGISCIGSNQIFNISHNTLVDCKRGIDVGDAREARIIGNSFNIKNQLNTWVDYNINLPGTLDATFTSEYLVSDCINNIVTPADKLPVFIPDIFGHKANITINDCIGNFAFILGARTLLGNVKITNTLMDYTTVTTGSNLCAVNISGKHEYHNCTVKFSNAYSLAMGVGSVVFNNCTVSSDAIMRLYYGASGCITTDIIDSKFTNVYIYDIRRAGSSIVLRDSTFLGYNTTHGLFESTVTQLANLTVIGCTFDPAILSVVPLKFSAGVANCVTGHNVFYTTRLTVGFFPNIQSRVITIGYTAQRPTLTSGDLDYRFYDLDLSKTIYWNGVKWVIDPSYTTNATTTAPTKTGLNILYGNLGQGSIITYASITGGGRDYFKLTDSNTSDWVQTIWADGIKSLATG